MAVVPVQKEAGQHARPEGRVTAMTQRIHVFDGWRTVITSSRAR
jgi:hypothetical protein